MSNRASFTRRFKTQNIAAHLKGSDMNTVFDKVEAASGAGGIGNYISGTHHIRFNENDKHLLIKITDVTESEGLYYYSWSSAGMLEDGSTFVQEDGPFGTDEFLPAFELNNVLVPINSYVQARWTEDNFVYFDTGNGASSAASAVIRVLTSDAQTPYQNAKLVTWNGADWDEGDAVFAFEGNGAVIPRGIYDAVLVGTSDGLGVYEVTLEEFPAIILDRSGYKYAWQEAMYEPQGKLVYYAEGRSGSLIENPSYEINKNMGVPYYSIVWMRRGYGSSNSNQEYLFAYEPGGQTVIVNVTNITNIYNAVNNYTYINTYNNTINYYFNNVWYIICPCDIAYPPSGSGSGQSPSDNCVPLPCDNCDNTNAPEDIGFVTDTFTEDYAIFNDLWNILQEDACTWKRYNGYGALAQLEFIDATTLRLTFTFGTLSIYYELASFNGDCCATLHMEVVGDSVNGTGDFPEAIDLYPRCCQQYWCVDGLCYLASEPPAGSSISGPFTSETACTEACEEIEVACCPGESIPGVLYAHFSSSSAACANGVTVPITYDAVDGWWEGLVTPTCSPPSAAGLGIVLWCDSGTWKVQDIASCCGPLLGQSLTVVDCNPLQLTGTGLSWEGVYCTGTFNLLIDTNP